MYLTNNLVSDPTEWTGEKAEEIRAALNESSTEKGGNLCYFSVKPTINDRFFVVCESHE